MTTAVVCGQCVATCSASTAACFTHLLHWSVPRVLDGLSDVLAMFSQHANVMQGHTCVLRGMAAQHQLTH